MKTVFECKSMDDAGALHNAFIDHMVVPEGMEVKVGILFDQSGNKDAPGGWITGWWVALEIIPVLCLADQEALSRKKPQPEG